MSRPLGKQTSANVIRTLGRRRRNIDFSNFGSYCIEVNQCENDRFRNTNCADANLRSSELRKSIAK